MAVEVEIDVEVLKSEIKKTYASVSEEPEKDFIFPTGRASNRAASTCSISAVGWAPTRSLPHRWSASKATSPAST
jgi:hypothetical protein